MLHDAARHHKIDGSRLHRHVANVMGEQLHSGQPRLKIDQIDPDKSSCLASELRQNRRATPTPGVENGAAGCGVTANFLFESPVGMLLAEILFLQSFS